MFFAFQNRKWSCMPWSTMWKWKSKLVMLFLPCQETRHGKHVFLFGLDKTKTKSQRPSKTGICAAMKVWESCNALLQCNKPCSKESDSLHGIQNDGSSLFNKKVSCPVSHALPPLPRNKTWKTCTLCVQNFHHCFFVRECVYNFFPIWLIVTPMDLYTFIAVLVTWI